MSVTTEINPNVPLLKTFFGGCGGQGDASAIDIRHDAVAVRVGELLVSPVIRDGFVQGGHFLKCLAFREENLQDKHCRRALMS